MNFHDYERNFLNQQQAQVNQAAAATFNQANNMLHPDLFYLAQDNTFDPEMGPSSWNRPRTYVPNNPMPVTQRLNNLPPPQAFSAPHLGSNYQTYSNQPLHSNLRPQQQAINDYLFPNSSQFTRGELE
jgi:hypothetical protein